MAEAVDPNATEAEVAIALEAQVAAAQVNTITSQTGALLEGSGVTDADGNPVDESKGIDAAFDALVAEIINAQTPDDTGATTTVDLTSPATLEQVVADAAGLAGATDEQQAAVAALAPDAAATTSALNTAVEDAVADAAGDPEAALIGIAQVQVVAEDIEDVVELGAATGDVGAAVDATVDAVLEAAIIEAANEVGNVVPEPELEPAPPPPPPPPPAPDPTKYVVVESDGVYLDADGDGVMDEPPVEWDSETLSLADNKVVIQINAYDTEMDLSGFGADDRIKISARNFLEDYYSDTPSSVAEYLPFTNSPTITYTSSPSYQYVSYPARDFYYTVYTSESSTTGLYVFRPAGGPPDLLGSWDGSIEITQNQLNFVGLVGSSLSAADPERSYVVVDTKAYVDINGNGVRDLGTKPFDNTQWDNNLAGADVTIRINRTPGEALDLTGFGAGDRIEIDLNNFASFFEIASSPNVTGLADGVLNVFSGPSTFGASHTRTHGTTGGENSWRAWFASYESQYASLYVWGSYALYGAPSIALSQISVVDLVVPTVATQVVVNSLGAWIVTDTGNALTGGEDAWLGDSLVGQDVTIRFNDVPGGEDGAIDLAGFGEGDQINIAIASIIDSVGLAASTPTEFARAFNSSLVWIDDSSSATLYETLMSPASGNLFKYELQNPGSEGYPYGNLSVSTTSFSSYLAAWTGPISITTGQIAFIDTAPAAYQQIVVPDGGLPYIDLDRNGSMNGDESALAADHVLGDGSFVIHFDGVPSEALSFSNFGEDDRIEIDLVAMGLEVTIASYSQIGGNATIGTARLGDLSSAVSMRAALNDLIVSSIPAFGVTNALGSFDGGEGHLPNLGQVDFVGLDYTLIVDFTTYATKGNASERASGYIDVNSNHAWNSATDILYLPRDAPPANPIDVDFANHSVVVHFDGLPTGNGRALDLTGFGADDSIEIAVQPLFDDMGIRSTAMLTADNAYDSTTYGAGYFTRHIRTYATTTRVSANVGLDGTSLTLFANLYTRTKGAIYTNTTSIGSNVRLSSTGQLVFLYNEPLV